MKAWKVFRKDNGVHVGTVWYSPCLDAFDVKESEEECFDFGILVKEIEAD